MALWRTFPRVDLGVSKSNWEDTTKQALDGVLCPAKIAMHEMDVANFCVPLLCSERHDPLHATLAYPVGPARACGVRFRRAATTI